MRTTDQCWVSSGKLYPNGYARCNIAGRTFGAHVVSYTLHVGPVPKGMVVRHMCDNRPCVNPYHLCLGTQRDNIGDAVERGRMASGENHGRSKLTVEDVRQIRCLIALGISNVWIGETYGVSHSTVSHIKRGRIWLKGTNGSQA